MASWQAGTGAAGVLQLSMTEIAVNIAGNTSTVAVAQDHYVPAATFWNTATTETWGLSGDVVNTGGLWAAPNVGSNRWINVYSGSPVIAHNADGTKSVSETAAVGATGTSGFGGPATVSSGAFALTTIPRQAFQRHTGAVYALERLDRHTGAEYAQQKMERWNGAAWVRQG